ncbi:hypothetical protein EsCd1HHP049_04590 [Escherichia sp. HH154_1D]|nr:hypothetical protein EsCd1HHP049_04590 [Escherichia sp. HH154_1D]
MGWSATIHFIAQDHFGLDVTDIKTRFTTSIDFFAYGSFYNGIKTLLSNLFLPILTLSKESKIIYEKQTPENYIIFISYMLHL